MQPPLIHLPDPGLAAALGLHLHEAGAVVIADPAYLTRIERHMRLVTVGAGQEAAHALLAGADDLIDHLRWEAEAQALLEDEGGSEPS